jgi:hypothetical protein
MFVPLLALVDATTSQPLPSWLQAVTVLTPVGLSLLAAFKASSLRGQRDRSRVRERVLRKRADNAQSPIAVPSKLL